MRQKPRQDLEASDLEASATSDMLARFRDGEQEAFQEIVGAFEARLVQFFYRLCWDRDQAEDLCQDLFLKLLRGAHRYQPQGRLATFIFRVATNLWIDHYRSMRPRGRMYSLDQVLLKGEPVLRDRGRQDTSTTSPSDALILQEEKESLRASLSALTEPHRLVMELAVYQDLPYAQISQILDIPVGTVKSRMHNCVKVLRSQLAQASGRDAKSSFRAGRSGGGA